MAQKKKPQRKAAPRKTASSKTAKRTGLRKGTASKKPAGGKTALKTTPGKTGRRKSVQRAAGKKTAQKKAWVITTSADRPIADVAKDLSKAGFKVDQTLEQIGVITGHSDDKVVGKARAVAGVTDVSPEQKIDIGPPNSTDTW